MALVVRAQCRVHASFTNQPVSERERERAGGSERIRTTRGRACSVVETTSDDGPPPSASVQQQRQRQQQQPQPSPVVNFQLLSHSVNGRIWTETDTENGSAQQSFRRNTRQMIFYWANKQLSSAPPLFVQQQWHSGAQEIQVQLRRFCEYQVQETKANGRWGITVIDYSLRHLTISNNKSTHIPNWMLCAKCLSPTTWPAIKCLSLSLVKLTSA